MSDPRVPGSPTHTATEVPSGSRGAAAEDPGSASVDTTVQYELWNEIARGGLGRIVRAWDRQLAREVVIKLPLGSKGHLRLAREALITAQLEHPAIVPVHAAGKLDDETPYYVMKLIAGRTFREEIGAAVSFAERIALLPKLIAVCEAVAYAHSKGVVHRDLKPGNVLVGEFGETTVVDWGMAKRLVGEEGEDRDRGFLTGDEAQTQVGEVIGTPAYMAPEQARAEPVDERADVYALGAMLYNVVCGAPPYSASTSKEIVRAVQEGPPPPIESREPHIPADLAAIAHKAMARDAADRYRTARDLADDLKRFQTGRLVAAHSYSPLALARRWLRRHRGIVAVGAAAALALLAVGAFAIRGVVQERNRATSQRAAAEELVDFMLVDLRRRLRQVGKLELLDGIAGKVDGYYKRIESTVDPGSEGVRRRAQAFNILSQVRESQGDAKSAIEIQTRVVGLMREILAQDPGSEDAKQGLARALVDLARRQVPVGAYKDARAALDEALRIVDAGPAGARWARMRATVLSWQAFLESSEGNLEPKMRLYREAVELQTKLLAEDPDNEDLGREMLMSHLELATGLSTMNKRAEGLPIALRAASIAERFSERSPADVEWLLGLASAKFTLGQIVGEGHDAEAVSYLEQAVAIRERLVGRDPDNMRWQRALAEGHHQLAQWLLGTGATPRAREQAAKAIRILERLVAREPKKAVLRDRLWMAYNTASTIDATSPKVAIIWLEAALRVVQRSAELHPSSAVDHKLARTHLYMGETQLELDRRAEARPNLEKACAMLDGLFKDELTDRDLAWDVAQCHASLAQVSPKEEAVKHLEESIRLTKELVAERPALTELKGDLAKREGQLAELQKR